MLQNVPRERAIALVDVAVHDCAHSAGRVDWREGEQQGPVKKTAVRCISLKLGRIKP